MGVCGGSNFSPLKKFLGEFHRQEKYQQNLFWNFEDFKNSTRTPFVRKILKYLWIFFISTYGTKDGGIKIKGEV